MHSTESTTSVTAKTTISHMWCIHMNTQAKTFGNVTFFDLLSTSDFFEPAAV